jgi:hypothetical protein
MSSMNVNAAAGGFPDQSSSRFHTTDLVAVARARHSAVVTAAGSVFQLVGHSDGVTGVEHDQRCICHSSVSILAKHPVHTGALRQEYRLTGKGEALRPTLELMEG